MATNTPSVKGLEDVVAGESGISTVDGIQGKLTYRGIDIRDLVKNSTFEETTYLLWYGTLPTKGQLDALHQQLTDARPLRPEILSFMKSLPKSAGQMQILRTVVSALSFYDAKSDDKSPDNLIRIATDLVAKTPTIVAAAERLSDGQEPIAPRSDLSYTANLLYMLSGKEPDDLAAKVLDEALIMHADHEFNASTFTARVVVSTLSDMYSAMVAAICALKGPSHGGANQDVMNLLRAVGSVDKVEQEIKDRLAAKQRIPGFGHRVYKTWDPRALLLKARSEDLSKRLGDSLWYEMSNKVEQTVWQEKKLYPNVDFYSASTYTYLGIPSDTFTPLFAVSRMSGWTAHAIEQYADNRLIRPRADYIGPVDVPYTPINRR